MDIVIKTIATVGLALLAADSFLAAMMAVSVRRLGPEALAACMIGTAGAVVAILVAIWAV